MSNTIKLYVSGWYECRVENPAALVDAAKFTPQELDPSRATVLHNAPPEVWEQLGNALLTEVTKLRAQNPPPAPPGATMVDQRISWGMSPRNALTD
jgi:hypothetical protein